MYPAVSKEKKRRPISNAPDNESKESLEVVVRRVSELLTKEESHTELVLESFIKKDIKSNQDLNVALNNTRDSPQLAEAFMERFKKVSGGLQLSHKEG